MTIYERIINDKASIQFIMGDSFDFIGLTGEKTFKDKLLEEYQKVFDSVEYFDAGAIYDEKNSTQNKYRPNGESAVNLEEIIKTLTSGDHSVVVNIKSILGRAKEVFLASLSSLFYDNKLGNSKLVILANEKDKELLHIKSGISFFEVTPPTITEISKEFSNVFYGYDIPQLKHLIFSFNSCYYRDIKMKIPDIFASIENGSLNKFIAELNKNNQQQISIPKISFQDIAGNIEAKESIQDSVDMFIDKEFYKKRGMNFTNGILLAGVPGCGKTMLGEASAFESDAIFIKVNMADLVTMWLGESEQNVKKLFASLELYPSDQKIVLFFDEFDSLGSTRGQDSNLNGTKNQMLIGLNNLPDNIFVIASTNKPELLDSAFTRNKRIGTKVLISLPNFNERKEVIEINLRKCLYQIDMDALAELTEGYSGADISTLCVRAAFEQKKRCELLKKNPDKEHIIQDDFIKALKKVKATVNQQEVYKLEKWWSENSRQKEV